MIFRRLEDWSNRKLYAVAAGFAFVFFSLVLIGPVSIIAWRYKLFEKTQQYKLSGAGLICVVILCVVLFCLVKHFINKLPQTKPGQQRIKFTLQMINAMILPGLTLAVLQLLKRNFELGYSTVLSCIYSIMGGIFVYFMFLKFLENEIDLRKEAAKNVAVRKREKYY